MLNEMIGGFTRNDFSSLIPKDGTWAKKSKVIARDVMYGTVGLFVLDVSWRLMDLGIDFICDHVHWLKFLSTTTDAA